MYAYFSNFILRDEYKMSRYLYLGPINQRHDESRLRIETNSYLVNKIDFDVMICTTCFIVKPPRTHHCRNCGYCIDVSMMR